MGIQCHGAVPKLRKRPWHTGSPAILEEERGTGMFNAHFVEAVEDAEPGEGVSLPHLTGASKF
jgi:hypothetical protein